MTPPDAKVTADARGLAEAFHDAYERLAPSFGYTTRTDTRKFDPDSPNGKLMQAVVAAVVGPVVAELSQAKETIADLIEQRGRASKRVFELAQVEIPALTARADAAEAKLAEAVRERDDLAAKNREITRQWSEQVADLRAGVKRLKTCPTCQSTGDGMPCAYPTETAKALRAEVERLTEENKGLRAGKPIGAVVGAMTIIEQDKTITDLRAQLAAAQELIAHKDQQLYHDNNQVLSLRQQLDAAQAQAREATKHKNTLLALVERYLKETPLGHQPSMIALDAERAIDAARREGGAT